MLKTSYCEAVRVRLRSLEAFEVCEPSTDRPISHASVGSFQREDEVTLARCSRCEVDADGTQFVPEDGVMVVAVHANNFTHVIQACRGTMVQFLRSGIRGQLSCRTCLRMCGVIIVHGTKAEQGVIVREF